MPGRRRTSLGQLLRLNEKTGEAQAALPPKPWLSRSSQRIRIRTVGLQLEGGEAVLKLVSPGAPGEAKLRAQTGQLEAQDKCASRLNATGYLGWLC